MKTERLIMLFFAVLLVAAAGSLVWLSRGTMVPPTQKVELTIPDDRIPR